MADNINTCLHCRTTLRFDPFTRLWSIRKALLSGTQNSERSGFSTAHAYKYKTKPQAKIKRRQRKNYILVG